MERGFWTICVTHMFLEVYLLVQVALIPVYIQEFQLSVLEASLVATIPGLIQLVMNVPSGYLADRFDARRLLFASMVMEGVSAILVSQTRSFWTLVLGVSMLRASSPLYHVSGLSKISRFVDRERMSRSMGFHNALGSLGSTMGLLSLSLSLSLSTIGWRWTYLFWSIPILAWGFVILKSLRGEGHTDGDVMPFGRDAQRRPENRGLPGLSSALSTTFLTFLTIIGIREMGITGASTFMTTYFVRARSLSEATASLIFGLGPVVGIFGSLAGGYMGEKVGERRTLGLAILGSALFLILMALNLSSGLYPLTTFYLLYSFFNNCVWSPVNTMVAKMTPAAGRGLSFSIYFFTEGLITSIAPTVAGLVVELLSVPFLFPFSAACLLASFILLHFLPYPGLHRGQSWEGDWASGVSSSRPQRSEESVKAQSRQKSIPTPTSRRKSYRRITDPG